MSHDERRDPAARVEILVVGAGMAGLTAAGSLAAAGRDVLVVDKGWYPGGRMATRTTQRARFDHGATFFYAAAGSFGTALEDWRRDGAAAPWEGLEKGAVHWRGKPDMRALGTHLAHGLRVVNRTRVCAVVREGDRWWAVLEGGGTVTADAVLLTPPVPQTLDLLVEGGFREGDGAIEALASLAYERCLVVMAELDGPGRVPAPGFVEPGEGPLARIVDERAKGTSAVTAVTLHASPEFSLARWEDDRDRVAAEMIAAAGPWTGDAVTAHQIHGWRYGRPVTSWPEPCLLLVDEPPLVLAGDAFGGPDLPGAHRSGLAAAGILEGRLAGA